MILLKHGANPYGTVCFAREVIRTYRPKCIYTSPWADDSSAVQYNIYVTHSRSNGAFSAQQNGKYILKTFCALHLGWVSLMLNFVPSIFGSPTDSPYCFIGWITHYPSYLLPITHRVILLFIYTYLVFWLFNTIINKFIENYKSFNLLGKFQK